jgi:hypothetical protein
MSESAPLNWKVGDVTADLYEVTGVRSFSTSTLALTSVFA